MKNRVTYYPPLAQRVLQRNAARIKGKPYARYFDPELWLHDAVMPAIRAPMDPSKALSPEARGLNSLLDPGYHEVENGYCALADGTAYVASHVPMPGITGEMYAWWFWWHAVEPERYTLWYPSHHLGVRPLEPAKLTAPGLTHAQRYVGTTHHVDELIGPERMQVGISFVAPRAFGLDESRFAEAGIVGHACARVSLLRPKLDVVTMVHLARKTKDGIEQRSRYWIAHQVGFSLFGQHVSVDGIAGALGFKKKLAGERVGYEQLLHDQTEFTHLSTFLADLHREFG